MSKDYLLDCSLKETKTKYELFFSLVRYFHNEVLFKSDKSLQLEDIKRYGDELYKESHINEYLHNVIDESVERYSSLSISSLKHLEKEDVVAELEKHNKWLDLALEDLNNEIND